MAMLTVRSARHQLSRSANRYSTFPTLRKPYTPFPPLSVSLHAPVILECAVQESHIRTDFFFAGVLLEQYPSAAWVLLFCVEHFFFCLNSVLGMT
ncbi:hypothetical protein BDW66DRAFT_119762 [Aspergillus desertorum]